MQDIKVFLTKKKKKSDNTKDDIKIYEQYKNLSEDQKLKLVEYRKIYYKMRKNVLL